MPNNPNFYIEDFNDGDTMEHDCGVVTKEEIIKFAEQFDPQYFHVDEEAAAKSMYQGLIASGWHTASITMRALVDMYLAESASLGSPGLDKLRWHLPVRPNDQLRVLTTVKSSRLSSTKPGIGILNSLIEVTNQNKELVLSMDVTGFFKSRDHKS